MVKYLIGAGADVDVQAKNGFTAFTIASTIDDADTEMVRLVASRQSLSVVGRGGGGGGGGGGGTTKNSSRNLSSSIAWMAPAKIVARAKNSETRELTVTKEQIGKTKEQSGTTKEQYGKTNEQFGCDSSAEGVTVDSTSSSSEAQAELYFDQEANKNGSLKHWWNRMSNR